MKNRFIDPIRINLLLLSLIACTAALRTSAGALGHFLGSVRCSRSTMPEHQCWISAVITCIYFAEGVIIDFTNLCKVADYERCVGQVCRAFAAWANRFGKLARFCQQHYHDQTVNHLACQGHSQNGIERGRAKKIRANKCHRIYLLRNLIEDVLLVYHGSL